MKLRTSIWKRNKTNKPLDNQEKKRAQNYKWRHYKKAMNNYTQIFWTTQKKWINSEKYKLPDLNHEETETQNRLITRREIESVNQKPPDKENPRTHGFTGKFYQSFKEYQLFSKSYKKLKWKAYFHIILQSQHYLDTKIRQGHYKIIGQSPGEHR